MKFTRLLLVFVPFLLVACANRAPLQYQQSQAEPVMHKHYHCKKHHCKNHYHAIYKHEPRIQMVRF